LNLRPRWVLATLLLLGAGSRLIHLGSPLLDGQACRQTETASIARGFATLSFSPLYPRLDIYEGAPGVELELQIYTTIVALLYRLFGVHEVIGRLVSIAFALAAIAYLYALGRRWLPGSGAAWASFFFAASPLAVFVGRNFQPDMAMAAFSIAGVYYLDRALHDAPRPRLGVFALAGTCIGASISLKATAAHVLLPCAWMIWRSLGRSLFRIPAVWAFALAALIPPAAWYLRAHQIYLESGITFLLAYNQNKLANVATFADPSYWRVLFLDRPVRLCFTFVGFALLLVSWAPWRWLLAAAHRSEPDPRPLAVRGDLKTLWIWLGAVVFFFLVVAKGNLIHNHYQLPLVAPGCLWIGLAIERLRILGAFGTPLRRGIATALLLIGLIQGAASISPQYKYNPGAFEAGRAYAALAAPSEKVIAVGAEYNTLLYYCGRPGWSFSGFSDFSADTLAGLVQKGVRHVVAVHPDDLLHSTLWGRVFTTKSVVKRGRGFWILEATPPPGLDFR